MNTKKALKHDIEIAGKTVPTIALIALFLVGTGSAALLSSFGTVSGEANVTQSIIVNNEGETELGTFGASFGGSNSLTAGEVSVGVDSSNDPFTVTNNMANSYTLTYETTVSGDTTEDLQFKWDSDGVSSQSGTDEVVRTTYANYHPNAGAESNPTSNYDAPTGTPDVNANDGDQVAKIENEADSGSDNTVVVKGDFTGQVSIGTDTTLLAHPDGATITHDAENIKVEGGAEVTVKGFELYGNRAGPGSDANGANKAFWVANDGSLDARYNVIQDQYMAVQSQSGGTTTSATVVGNEISQVTSGIGLQQANDDVLRNNVINAEVQGISLANADNVTVSNNTVKVDDTSLSESQRVFSNSRAMDFGWDSGTSDVEIKRNILSSTEVGVIVQSNADDSNIINYNRFDTEKTAIDASGYSGSTSLDATENFFVQGTWSETYVNNVEGDVEASYQTAPETLEAGETATVVPVHEFSIMADPSGTYDLTTTIQ